MTSTIFNLAKNHFAEQLIKDNFLEALKEKGYIKCSSKNKSESKLENKSTFCGDLLKTLFTKKYITKETYDSILEEYGQEKSRKKNKISKKKEVIHKKKAMLGEIVENPLIEMIEEYEEKSAIKNETYEITHEEYIDYENIQVDGVEYYLHKKNMSIVDVCDFRDIGHWDKEKCGIVFLNSDCSERHSSRVSL